MTELQLGDYVTYKTKRIDVEGIIISIDNLDYLIKPIKRKGVPQYHYGIYVSQSVFIPDEFPGITGYRTSKDLSVRVGRTSKNIKSNMKEYDPTQAGDTDEDI